MGSKKRFLRKAIVFTSLMTLFFAQPLSIFAQHNNIEVEQKAKEKRKYIIVLKEKADQDKFIQKKKLNEKKSKKGKLSKMITAELDSTELKSMQQDTEVAYIELDSTVEIASINDIDKQNKEVLQMQADDQTTPWGVKAIGADLVHDDQIKGDQIKIAVLDTGISEQPDLNVKGGVSFIEGNNSYEDDNGHGTHVAGTIAALDNGAGVVGVAPNANIYAVKVLDNQGKGSYSQVIQGVEWAIQNDMDIISMSFGGLSLSQALHDAIKEANDSGILIVAAAGNRGRGEETELYPALFSEVISVGATTQNNRIASFSSTGKELDIVAPGVDILSTLNDGQFGVLSGTSMAVPHITGAAALLWSNNYALTNDEIKSKLYEAATTMGEQEVYGHGLVNIPKALGYTNIELPPGTVEPGDPSNGSDPSIVIPNFDITDIDNELLILSDQLYALQKRAYNDGNIPLAKQISQKYNELLQQAKELHSTPEELNTKLPDESSTQSVESQMNSYFETKEDDFKQLINTYIQTLASFQSRFEEDQTDEGPGEISVSAYDLKGNNQTITAGQSATVSLKLASPKARIDVSVYLLSNPNNLVATNTLYNKPADTTISYTWTSNSTTVPGEYRIKFHYPDNNTDDSDNYWTIFVQAAEPPVNDNLEPNNSTATAVPASPGDSFSSFISSANDKDYYKFIASSDGIVDISLSVPYGKDYDFSVYDRFSNRIGGGNSRYNYFEQTSVSVVAGSTYYVLVEGYNGSYGPDPYNLSLGRVVLLPPTKPTGLTASSKSNSISTRWNAVDGATIYYVKLNGVQITTTTNTSYNFTGLTPGTLYTIEIAAANNAGLSPYNSISLSTINETYESNDTKSTAYTISAGSSYVSYISHETDIDYYKFLSPGTGIMNMQLTVPELSDFDVEITDASGTVVGMGRSSTGLNETVDFSVKSGTTYYIKISGFRSSYSHDSYILVLSDLITSLPTAPTGLSATATDMSVTLSWSRVSSATSYKIQKDGVDVGSVSGTSYTVTGLKPNTSYTFGVSASNPLGTSSYTKIVKSTTSLQISEIKLNSPIDVDLPKGQYQIFKFIPQVSGEYQIATGPFAGIGAINDTVLYLSKDSAESNIINQNDDKDSSNRFSQIRHSLTAGTSYYIKIKHYSSLEKVHARLSVTKVGAQEIKALQLNSPVDIETPENEPALFVFTPAITGNYIFQTNYYGDDFNQEPSDTAIYVYSDASFSNQIDMNDDIDPDNGNYFSGLNLSLIGGTNYYFKISGFMDGPVHARFLVRKEDSGGDIGNDYGSAFAVSLDSTTDSAIDYPGDIDFFRFQAPFNGVYTFDSIGSTDTVMELYDQSQILFDYSDDAIGVSPRITNELYAGRNYYLKVYHYDMAATGLFSLKVMKQEDNVDGELISLNAPITRMIDYEGDEDIFVFIPPTSGVYVFRTTGYADTVGHLLDENENLIIDNDDNSTQDRNFSFSMSLSANVTYYLKVKLFDGTKKDEYYTLIVN